MCICFKDEEYIKLSRIPGAESEEEFNEQLKNNPEPGYISLRLIKEFNRFFLYAIGDDSGVVEIYFCPFCGRQLDVPIEPYSQIPTPIYKTVEHFKLFTEIFELKGINQQVFEIMSNKMKESE